MTSLPYILPAELPGPLELDPPPRLPGSLSPWPNSRADNLARILSQYKESANLIALIGSHTDRLDIVDDVIVYRCRDATTGAAVWAIDAAPSDASPQAVARAPVAGTAAELARADHVHDGGLRVIRATITSAASIVSGDEICRVNTSGGAVVLTLPNPSAARDFLIKKINADANGITLRPHVTTGSGPTIEGGSAGADLLLDGSDAAERGAWYVFSDGSSWWVG